MGGNFLEKFFRIINCKAGRVKRDIYLRATEIGDTWLSLVRRMRYVIYSLSVQQLANVSAIIPSFTPNDFYTTIQGVPIVSVVSQKTHIPAKIPLNIFPWLMPILEKHNFSSPDISMQNLNEWIKDICLNAGFTNKVLKIEQYMGRKPTMTKKYLPKYTQISSHTCRRSFATNLYC